MIAVIKGDIIASRKMAAPLQRIDDNVGKYNT